MLKLLFILVCCNVLPLRTSDDCQYIIPDSIYSFFPITTRNNIKMTEEINISNAEEIDLPYFATEFVITFIVKIYKFNNMNELLLIENDLESKSLKAIISDSDDYFIIGSERELKAKYDSVFLVCNFNQVNENDLIINFHEIFDKSNQFYDPSTICGLKKGYKILVLESGSKYVMDNKYKTEWKFLPDKLKHGYRSGVAFKKGEPFAIFWTFTW